MMNPMNLEPYIKQDYESVKNAYLICQDYIVGVAFFAERNLALKYTQELAGKVKYAEDCAYVSMIADDIHIEFFDDNFVWYEYGEGISTNGSTVWGQRITADNQACFCVIAEKHPAAPPPTIRISVLNIFICILTPTLNFLSLIYLNINWHWIYL